MAVLSDFIASGGGVTPLDFPKFQVSSREIVPYVFGQNTGTFLDITQNLSSNKVYSVPFYIPQDVEINGVTIFTGGTAFSSTASGLGIYRINTSSAALGAAVATASDLSSFSATNQRYTALVPSSLLTRGWYYFSINAGDADATIGSYASSSSSSGILPASFNAFNLFPSNSIIDATLMRSSSRFVSFITDSVVNGAPPAGLTLDTPRQVYAPYFRLVMA